jgi:hypothetical protein
MDATGGHYVKRNKPGSETQKPRFPLYVEDTSKDKHIDKNKHDHPQTQMSNMFVTVQLLYRSQGKRERNREW